MPDEAAEAANEITDRVHSFIDDMQRQEIHVGYGSNPKCITCGMPWPCPTSKKDSD